MKTYYFSVGAEFTANPKNASTALEFVDNRMVVYASADEVQGSNKDKIPASAWDNGNIVWVIQFSVTGRFPTAQIIPQKPATDGGFQEAMDKAQAALDADPNVKEDLQAALATLTALDETKLSEEQIAARTEMVQKLQDAIAALEPSEDNAPVITLKLVDAKGNAVDTADATLTEISHKENISQGKTTYNYEFKLDIINALKYAYTYTDADTARELKDENGKTIAITGTIGCTFDSDENTFKLTGMTKAATFIVKLVEANTVKVSVSDSVVLDVAPTILADGTAWEGTTITLTLKDGMAEQGYALPQVIEVKVGKTLLVFGTDYAYDRNTGVITFKDSTGIKKLSAASPITITSPASLADSVSVTLTKGNVSPMSIKVGTQFSTNPTFQIFPNDGYGYPEKVTKIEMKNRAGVFTALVAGDWTYDAKTGIVTLQGEKSVIGEIKITASSAKRLITSLTVSERGAVTEAPASGDEFQYMLVHPTDDATLFATVASDVDGWLKLTPFTVPTGNWRFTTEMPTLSIDDNGSYLVVIEVASGKIVKAGYALLDGITSGTPDAPLRMADADSHLTPTMENGVITLTPDTDDEWVLPLAVTRIIIGGEVLSSGEFSYNAEDGTITLNTTKTGDIVISAVAEKKLEILENVAASRDGVVTARDSEGNVSFTASDKFVVLASDTGVAEILKSLNNGLDFDGLLSELGLTADDLTAETVNGNVNLTAAAHEGGYVLALVIENGKVIKAGIGANSFDRNVSVLGTVTLNPGRIWNAYGTNDDGTANKDAGKIPDNGSFSGMYTQGTYKIVSGGDLSEAVKEVDGAYSITTVIEARGIKKHWNGADEPMQGWWTGVCVDLGDNVTNITVKRGNTALITDGTGSTIMYENADGTSGIANRAVSIYVNAENPIQRDFVVTLTTSNGPITLNWTVQFDTTSEQ